MSLRLVDSRTPVTDRLIEEWVAAQPPEPELDALLFPPPAPARDQVVTYHAVRPPRDLAEALTAAYLLALPPDAVEAIRRDWGRPSLDRRPSPTPRHYAPRARWADGQAAAAERAR